MTVEAISVQCLHVQQTSLRLSDFYGMVHVCLHSCICIKVFRNYDFGISSLDKI